MLSRVFTGSALIRSDVIRLATGLVTADLWLAIPSQDHSTTGLLGVKTSVRVSHSYILIISFPGLMYGMWPFNIFCSSIPLHIITSPGSFSYCLVFNIPSYPNITFPGSPSYCLFFRVLPDFWIIDQIIDSIMDQIIDSQILIDLLRPLLNVLI